MIEDLKATIATLESRLQEAEAAVQAFKSGDIVRDMQKSLTEAHGRADAATKRADEAEAEAGKWKHAYTGDTARLADVAEAAEHRAATAEKALQPPDSWYGEGEAVALAHGFTKEQYRAAKAIEYRIFGFYQWQNQGDRAASMMVQICQAIKDATAAAESALQEALAREAGKDEALKKAAECFRDYENLHLVKETHVGRMKADRNADMAEMCESALSTTSPSPLLAYVEAGKLAVAETKTEQAYDLVQEAWEQGRVASKGIKEELNRWAGARKARRKACAAIIEKEKGDAD